MLRIHNLGKRYGDTTIFEGLTRTFPAGCVALCEEESTGKSTLLNAIAGALTPDSGEIWIDGHSLTQSPEKARSRLAYVPHDCLIHPARTGREHLARAALEKQVEMDDEAWGLARRLGLEPHLDKPFEQMSTGTRRKVFLTAAALGNPAVIIADGPSDGLDRQARTALAEQFRIWSLDRVILFASHDQELVRACRARTVAVATLR